jgi:hypothetical protein
MKKTKHKTIVLGLGKIYFDLVVNNDETVSILIKEKRKDTDTANESPVVCEIKMLQNADKTFNKFVTEATDKLYKIKELKEQMKSSLHELECMKGG